MPLLLAHKPNRTSGIFWLNSSETLVDITTKAVAEVRVAHFPWNLIMKENTPGQSQQAHNNIIGDLSFALWRRVVTLFLLSSFLLIFSGIKPLKSIRTWVLSSVKLQNLCLNRFTGEGREEICNVGAEKIYTAWCSRHQKGWTKILTTSWIWGIFAEILNSWNCQIFLLSRLIPLWNLIDLQETQSVYEMNSWKTNTWILLKLKLWKKKNLLYSSSSLNG